MFQVHEQGAVTFRIKANFRALGPRLGKNVQAVKQALEKGDGGELFASLAKEGSCEVLVNGEAVKLDRTEVEVVVEAQSGFAAETGRVGVIVVHTTLTENLIDDGLLRRLIRRIQESRKKNLAKYTDRISLTLELGEGSRLRRVISRNVSQIEENCLVLPGKVSFGDVSKDVEPVQIGDESVRFSWTISG